MKLAIYNGFLSDSNEFILIDTKEISLKKAIAVIQKYIDSVLSDPGFEDSDETEDLKDFYIIGEHRLIIEKNKNIDVSNYELKSTGWGFSYIRTK